MSGERELPATIRIGAIDKLTAVIDKVKNKFPDLTKSVSRTNTMFGLLQKTTEKYSEALKKTGEGFKKFGETMSLAITAPVLAAAGLSVKSFADLEDALAEVRVTTHLSGDELQVFGKHIADISTKIPVSQEELLKLASAAGEAGVRGSDNLEKFSVTLAKLGKVAGVSGEEVAEPIAKLLELTGDGHGKIENYASAVLGLGEKYQVSAKNLVESSITIGRVVAPLGVSTSQILALTAAVEPLGFNAKASSTAVAEGFHGIDEAIKKGGEHIRALSIMTGIAGADLKREFHDNPTVVFQKFLEGLNKIQQKGGDTGAALQFFGASGEKTATILTSLGKNTDKLNGIFKESAEQFEKNTALTHEYELRTATFNSKLTLLHNNVTVLAQALGQKLMPFVSAFVDILIGGLQFLEAHPTFATLIAVFAGLAAVIGPVVGIFGVVLTMLPGLIAGWAAFTAIMAGFGITSLAALAPILLTIGAYALIAAAVVGLIALMWHFRDSIIQAVLWPFKQVLGVIEFVIDKVTKLGGAIAGLAGFGSKKLDLGIETPQGTIEQPGSLGPQGAALGGTQAAANMNNEFQTRTNNAHVDIHVRAPTNTTIVGESDGGFLNINRGMAGAF